MALPLDYSVECPPLRWRMSALRKIDRLVWVEGRN